VTVASHLRQVRELLHEEIVERVSNPRLSTVVSVMKAVGLTVENVRPVHS
jgi:DNA-binding phage protein